MSVKGYVMQIQPFSVNDGDGIRTTIFMAGCPLRCRWCANPEGFTKKRQVGWYQRKCIGCAECAQVCPKNIGIHLNAAREKCDACGKCVTICPTKARAQMVRFMDTKEVLQEIQKYALFYHYSGGGVSFSGGECTTQPIFLNDLTERIYDMGYSMDMETCGYFSFDTVRASLERMDLIFVDLKHINDDKHKYFTGVSNVRILENIRRLNDVLADVVVRIPIICGVNNDEENIRRSASYVQRHLAKAKIELLPYHELGTIKYEALGMPYAHNAFSRPSKEELEHLKEVIRAEGVETIDFT